MPFSRTWFLSFLFISSSACSHFGSHSFFSLFIFGTTWRFLLSFIQQREKKTKNAMSFFHFMPLLKPLAPLFPFPAEEHVVFIFYFDILMILGALLFCVVGGRSYVRSFIHSCVFFLIFSCLLALLLLFPMLFVFFRSTLLLKAPLQYIK